MIEVLTVLATVRKRGADTRAFTERFKIGALPRQADADEDGGGDTAKITESQIVRVFRTPNTQQYVLPSSHVMWRDEQWIVRFRTEVSDRSQYDLTLERTA